LSSLKLSPPGQRHLLFLPDEFRNITMLTKKKTAKDLRLTQSTERKQDFFGNFAHSWRLCVFLAAPYRGAALPPVASMLYKSGKAGAEGGPE
jgi:hypothetical protein